MSKRTELENALKDAMRAQDDLRKRVVRMSLAAVKMAEIEKKTSLDDAAVIAVLQKELKSRQETISEAQRGGRPELVAENEAEIGVLREFLPKALSPLELENLVREIIAETGASSPADMGKVMKLLTPRLEGRASGAEASQVVRRLLQ